ncbi:hypothetical protein [Alteribacter lacisalsi]|uniref:hypothetical protein n=1 Tax=Alteribacter lacisalsi TaxID=2045244 RepID=UPI00137506DE|nr:hypothetical protein [Alteribacter lacisalsi]
MIIDTVERSSETPAAVGGSPAPPRKASEGRSTKLISEVDQFARVASQHHIV